MYDTNQARPPSTSHRNEQDVNLAGPSTSHTNMFNINQAGPSTSHFAVFDDQHTYRALHFLYYE